MRRPTLSPTGSKFTVRGQVYIQTGAFFHAMSNDREVRVLELATICPECGDEFSTTASMTQIKNRQLVRRCPIAAPVPRKAAAKKATGRKTRPAPRRPATLKFEPPAQITLLEIRPVDVLPGETPGGAMQRALSGRDGPAEPPADLEQRQRRDALGMLD
jgi:hypothetical protein